MKIRPKVAYLDPEPLKVVAKYIYNWPYFSLELFRKSKLMLMQDKSRRWSRAISTIPFLTYWWTQ
jgi:hypothetical protein